MWSSVRARIVAMTTMVVVSSVALTAVIVSLSVQHSIEEEAARSLSNDAAIYQSLLEYGFAHASWAEVDGVVRDLAERYNRRIALKAEDGRLLADSDRLLGISTGPLRPRPDAGIDAFDPRIKEFGAGYFNGGALISRPTTEEDLQVNSDRTKSTASCLDRLGVSYEVLDMQEGLREISVSQELTDVQWEASSGCLKSMYMPLPSDIKRIAAENDALLACMRSRGIEPTVSADEYGHTVAIDPDQTSEVEVYDACREEATRAPYAPPVQLFLGTADRSGLSVEALATGRTLLIVVGIVAIAGCAAVGMSVRIVRPLRTLTAAVDRLGGGDLQARAGVLDRGEIGTLAKVFNRMADSLSHSEAARKQMIADIAHELRNPLVTINGSLEAVQDGIYDLTPELINSLAEETDHLRHLVADLQELAIADAGELTVTHRPVNLAELLPAVAAAHAPLAEGAGIALDTTITGHVVVAGDETRLRQVIGNLLGNAIAHTSAGGRVAISATGQPDAVTITVTDTGEGIPAEQIGHVFERFWRADPARSRATGRTGLGLAISDALIHAHDGTIVVDSILGVGTTFTITLPTGPTAGDERSTR